jgi:hypothetical protein
MQLSIVKIVRWIAYAIVLAGGGFSILTFLSMLFMFSNEARNAEQINAIKEVALAVEMHKMYQEVYPLSLDIVSLAPKLHSVNQSNAVKGWKYRIVCEYEMLSANKYRITSIMPSSLCASRVKRTYVYIDGQLEESVIE